MERYVVKRDGTEQPFNKNKIINAMYRAYIDENPIKLLDDEGIYKKKRKGYWSF